MTHSELCKVVEKWLKSVSCGVVLRDQFRAKSAIGEQPDAVGWRRDCSILVVVGIVFGTVYCHLLNKIK